MIDAGDMCRGAGIDRTVLETWIEAGWIHPRSARGTPSFLPIDVARAQLIRDLTSVMAVNDEGVVVVLDLLDQIHSLRYALRGVMWAVSEQKVPIRRHIRSGARKFARETVKEAADASGQGTAA